MSCKPPKVPATPRNPGWRTQYSEIKNKLQTGDIILVHGRYPYSWIVELLQGSRYGHCAMVVKRDDLHFNSPPAWEIPEIMLWESNTKMTDSNVHNLWSKHEIKEGPMLVSLEQRLHYSQNNYEDVCITWRPLHAERANIRFKDILGNYFTSVIDRLFPDTELEILTSVLLGRWYNRSAPKATDFLTLDIIADRRGRKQVFERFVDDRPSRNRLFQLPEGVDDPNRKDIFCSELVAATYEALGILTRTHVNNAYAPLDFSDDGRAPLLQRAWLGPEMYIDMCG